MSEINDRFEKGWYMHMPIEGAKCGTYILEIVLVTYGQRATTRLPRVEL